MTNSYQNVIQQFSWQTKQASSISCYADTRGRDLQLVERLAERLHLSVVCSSHDAGASIRFIRTFRCLAQLAKAQSERKLLKQCIVKETSTDQEIGEGTSTCRSNSLQVHMLTLNSLLVCQE